VRPMALGRKNWIHIGSQQAGPKAAAILSIVETCRRLKIPIRDYLAAVLPGIADVSIQRLADLTPAAWAARKQVARRCSYSAIHRPTLDDYAGVSLRTPVLHSLPYFITKFVLGTDGLL
jgi:hypothetical protein